MATTSNPYNYSYHAVPAAFIYALVPHSFYLVRLMVATKNQMSLAMPRTNLDVWKSKLPASVWNQLARARGAHHNSLEVFPLFAAAMIGGNVAGLPAQDLNNVALSFFTARTVYLALYLGLSSNALAPLRTGAYAWSIGIPMLALWRAGKAAAGEV